MPSERKREKEKEKGKKEKKVLFSVTRLNIMYSHVLWLHFCYDLEHDSKHFQHCFYSKIPSN